MNASVGKRFRFAAALFVAGLGGLLSIGSGGSKTVSADPVATSQADDDINQTRQNIYRTKDATYKSGAWEYKYYVSGRASRSAGKHGGLSFGDKKVPEPADINDFYRTPWGPMYWVGQQGPLFVPHGWMLDPADRKPAGKEIPGPATSQPAGQPASGPDAAA